MAMSAKSAGKLDGYDAFVIGSAVYMGSWLKEPAEFVRRNRAVLAGRPVWLFSSGPLGTEPKDPQGRDLREVSVPKEIAEFEQSIRPRDHHVFYGALDHTKFGFAHRALWALPASRKLLIEGDFRDWHEIEAWGAEIATKLTPVPV